MKPRLLGTVLGMAMAIGCGWAMAEEWTLPAGEPRLKPGAGVEVATANCVLCHSVDYIVTQPPLSRDQWKATVTKMQQKFGAMLPADKVEPVLDYLARNYGK